MNGISNLYLSPPLMWLGTEFRQVIHNPLVFDSSCIPSVYTFNINEKHKLKIKSIYTVSIEAIEDMDRFVSMRYVGFNTPYQVYEEDRNVHTVTSLADSQVINTFNKLLQQIVFANWHTHSNNAFGAIWSKGYLVFIEVAE